MRYVFVGQNIMGGQTLSELLSSGYRPELVVTREANSYANVVEKLALDWGIPIERTSNINQDARLVARLEHVEPDVIFCSAWANIIRQPLLDLPRLGWVNFHPSYLPEYRGASPISWQLINGEEWGGCTAHFMTAQFDRGNIIVQERIRIDPEDDAETLREKCGRLLGLLAVRTWGILAEEPDFKGVPQDPAAGSYFLPRDSHHVIDCTRGSREIVNLVRGLSPYPCAVLRCGKLELRIAALRFTDRLTDPDEVGRVVGLQEDRLLVGTADLVVEVTSLRLGDYIASDYLREFPELGILAAPTGKPESRFPG